MSRYRYLTQRPCVHGPQSRRRFCVGVSAIYITAFLLWFFAVTADALQGITESQCDLILEEFQHTFVRAGDGYPCITSCESRIVRLMWDQQIQRVYSTDGLRIDTYEVLRSLPDAQFAKLVINAAAGSLMDSSQQGSEESLVRIRIDSHGHFQRYVLNDSNRITTLQTMLVLSIVTLAVTWWRIDMKQHMQKTA